MTIFLVLLVSSLLLSVTTETHGQIVTLSAQLYTTVDLSCSCQICLEGTIAVQWYRSSNPDVFTKDKKAIAWWYRGETGNSLGFGINDDFSMIIHHVNLTDQGLYRCVVTPAGGGAESTHDVLVDIYAKPVSTPSMRYIRRANGFIVTCSISNVFPLAFPKLRSNDNGTAEVNEDGTYNTSVSHLFPLDEKDKTIECLYSNMDFKSMSSLRLVYIDQPDDEDRVPKNVSWNNLSKECTVSGIWMIWVTLIIEVFNLIVVSIILSAMKSGRMILGTTRGKTTREGMDDTNGEDEQSIRVEEPIKPTRIVCSVKLCGALTMLIFQIVVIILLIVHLGRINVHAGAKAEMCSQHNC